jgi:hypothetical protein
MANVINFYLDDSGTRRPDHDPGKRAAHRYDWFALGGVLVKQEEEERARLLHDQFLEKWPQIKNRPLHSVEVRGRTGAFLWLEGLCENERNDFLEALYQLMREAPVVGLACVIDRSGYNARYFQKYGRQPWSLCKTAFARAKLVEETIL